MNYNDISKRIMYGEKINNIHLRACYYARVSTDSDVQLNSLDNQLNYYENYIKSNSNWTYINGYVDEGISGVTIEKRKSFKRMLNDAKLGKFDLIITKEVSRFARDLEDSIHYIRELKDSNVGVFFENQNLNTFDSNSELILNIMFNLAQEESKKLSTRVKFGHKEAINKGHVLGSSNIIGYKKDKCKLIIVKEEAELIKKIYELYVTGKYGLCKLSKELAYLGYYNKKGNLYDKDTLKRIIQNPKYKGYYRGHVYETIDYRTKKRKRIPENMQIIHKCIDGTIPPIVSEDLWERANEILKSRTKNNNNNLFSGSLKYAFSSKLYCKEHNVKFQRSHGSRKKNRPTWSCGLYLQHRLSSCISPIISEKDLYIILERIMNNIIPIDIKDNMINLYNNVSKTNDYDQELKIINNKLKTIEDKKSLALNLVYSGDIKKEELKMQFKLLENNIQELNEKKAQILKQNKILKQNTNNIDIITEAIHSEMKSGLVDGFIRRFVLKIIVSKINNDRHNIKLDIFLNVLENKSVIKEDIDYTPFIENENYNSTEIKKDINKRNKFTYNVYVDCINNSLLDS